jgi:hypothetical protein
MIYEGSKRLKEIKDRKIERLAYKEMEQEMTAMNKKARDRFVDYLINHEMGYVRALGWFVQRGWPDRVFESLKDLLALANNAAYFTPRNLTILMKSWDEYERSMKDVRKERQNDSVSEKAGGANAGTK